MILTAFIANLTAEPGLAPAVISFSRLEFNNIRRAKAREGRKARSSDDDETPLVHISLIARGRIGGFNCSIALFSSNRCSGSSQKNIVQYVQAVQSLRYVQTLINGNEATAAEPGARSRTATCFERQACRCLIYIDLNMVRAGVVNHPEKWKESGFIEIQKLPKRYTRPIRKSRLAG
jgi:hypothetical protein